MATRNGSAEWRGDLRGGGGDLTVGDGVFKGAYSFSSRFEEGEGTNPEELIAAAHAACFSMALANIMAEHGHPAESVRTEAKVHLGPAMPARRSSASTWRPRAACPASTRSTSPSTPRRRRPAARSPARSQASRRST